MRVAIVGAGASVGKRRSTTRGWGSSRLVACQRGSLALKERKVLVACGAGTGLAAVYQVPLLVACLSLRP